MAFSSSYINREIMVFSLMQFKKINRGTCLMMIINTKLTKILQSSAESDMNIAHTPVDLYAEPIQSYEEYENFMVKDVKTYGFVFPSFLYDHDKPKRMTYNNNKSLKYEDKYLSEQTGSIESLLIRNEINNNTRNLYMKIRDARSMEIAHGSIVRIGELLKITEHTITTDISSRNKIKTEKEITWDVLEQNEKTYLLPYTKEKLRDRDFDSLNFDAEGQCSLKFTHFPTTNPEISYTLVFRVTPLNTNVIKENET